MPFRAGPDRLIEWLFAGMMLSWGAWLLSPAWTTFDNPQYAALASLAREEIWAAWSIGVAALRMGALVVNGRYRRTPLLRIACSLLGLIWWLVLIHLFLITPQQNPPAGFSWYPVFVLFEAVSCWRSAADAFHADAFRGFDAPFLRRRRSLAR